MGSRESIDRGTRAAVSGARLSGVRGVEVVRTHSCVAPIGCRSRPLIGQLNKDVAHFLIGDYM